MTRPAEEPAGQQGSASRQASQAPSTPVSSCGTTSAPDPHHGRAASDLHPAYGLGRPNVAGQRVGWWSDPTSHAIAQGVAAVNHHSPIWSADRQGADFVGGIGLGRLVTRSCLHIPLTCSPPDRFDANVARCRERGDTGGAPDGEMTTCATELRFSSRCSPWLRSAPGPPTSWCGGMRAERGGGRGGQGNRRRLRAGHRQADRAGLSIREGFPRR